jgi:hypothetical protein
MSNIMTPMFRVSYPTVFKAKKNDMSGEFEYSVVALFPKGTDLNALRKAAQEAVIEKWGNNKAKWPENLRSPFRDQSEKGKFNEELGKKVLPPGHEEGGVFMNLKSKQRPGVVDGQLQDIIDETQFYAGCFARATIRPYAYSNKGNNGVAFGLQNLQKMKDGDTLTTRVAPSEEFAPIASATEAAPANATSLFD